jgi:hypothetical protein
VDELKIERLGGLGGFGLPNSAVRSVGVTPLSALSHEDRSQVDTLFGRRSPADTAVADGFRYKLSRRTLHGTETVEVPEADVPETLKASVKDELC